MVEQIDVPLRDVLQGLYVGGEVELFRRELAGSRLVVAVAGDDWGFSPESFADLTAEVVALERRFFADLDQPPYLVSLLPVGTPDARDRSLGGTGLHRAFAAFTRPGISLDPQDPMYLPEQNFRIMFMT